MCDDEQVLNGVRQHGREPRGCAWGYCERNRQPCPACNAKPDGWQGHPDDEPHPFCLPDAPVRKAVADVAASMRATAVQYQDEWPAGALEVLLLSAKEVEAIPDAVPGSLRTPEDNAKPEECPACQASAVVMGGAALDVAEAKVGEAERRIAELEKGLLAVNDSLDSVSAEGYQAGLAEQEAKVAELEKALASSLNLNAECDVGVRNDAYAAGRAEGYKAGIDAAAKVCAAGKMRDWANTGAEVAGWCEDRIRELAEKKA